MELRFEDDHRELLALSEDRARTLEEDALQAEARARALHAEAARTRAHHWHVVLKKLGLEKTPDADVLRDPNGYPVALQLPDPAAPPPIVVDAAAKPHCGDPERPDNCPCSVPPVPVEEDRLVAEDVRPSAEAPPAS